MAQMAAPSVQEGPEQSSPMTKQQITAALQPFQQRAGSSPYARITFQNRNGEEKVLCAQIDKVLFTGGPLRVKFGNWVPDKDAAGITVPLTLVLNETHRGAAFAEIRGEPYHIVHIEKAVLENDNGKIVGTSESKALPAKAIGRERNMTLRTEFSVVENEFGTDKSGKPSPFSIGLVVDGKPLTAVDIPNARNGAIANVYPQELDSKNKPKVTEVLAPDGKSSYPAVVFIAETTAGKTMRYTFQLNDEGVVKAVLSSWGRIDISAPALEQAPGPKASSPDLVIPPKPSAGTKAEQEPPRPPQEIPKAEHEPPRPPQEIPKAEHEPPRPPQEIPAEFQQAK